MIKSYGTWIYRNELLGHPVLPSFSQIHNSDLCILFFNFLILLLHQAKSHTMDVLILNRHYYYYYCYYYYYYDDDYYYYYHYYYCTVILQYSFTLRVTRDMPSLKISFSWKSHENVLKNPRNFFVALKTVISDFMVLNYVMKFPWNSLPVIFMNHEKFTKPWIWIFMGHESLIYFRPIHFMTPEKAVTA